MTAPRPSRRRGVAPPPSQRKPYVRPVLERMNETIPVTHGQPSVAGPTAAAQASPVAPGATVF